MFTLRERKLLGEVALFPRAAAGRVLFADADRVELGYWLRADETGRGLVAAAAKRHSTLRRTSRASRARKSGATPGMVPAQRFRSRLGYPLLTTVPEPGVEGVNRDMQVWVSELSNIHVLAG